MPDQPTVNGPSFQPRRKSAAAAYLLWLISEKVVPSGSGCWEWQGARNLAGYGFLDMKHHPEAGSAHPQVHRIIYQVCVGPIPEGACVLHRCDNPPCCRPDHLFLGTHLDNVTDKVSKGRQACGQKVRGNHDHLKGEGVKTARLTAERVMEMRRREAAGETFATLAADFGISTSHVGYVVSGKAWSHLPILNGESRQVRTCPKCKAVVVTRLGKFNAHVGTCTGPRTGQD